MVVRWADGKGNGRYVLFDTLRTCHQSGRVSPRVARVQEREEIDKETMIVVLLMLSRMNRA